MYDSQGVHPLAARGFGAEAETYALARPSYPEACAGWLRELGLGPGAVALEVGAGTGKFTGRLLETGARVIDRYERLQFRFQPVDA